MTAQPTTTRAAPSDSSDCRVEKTTTPEGAPLTPAGRVGPHTLREYALLADGERGALIGPSGEVAWMCAPHWDADAVFSALIGGRGSYVITPVGRFTWGGYYENGLIWRSRWVTARGSWNVAKRWPSRVIRTDSCCCGGCWPCGARPGSACGWNPPPGSVAMG